jgi:hypothetical protein
MRQNLALIGKALAEDVHELYANIIILYTHTTIGNSDPPSQNQL